MADKWAGSPAANSKSSCGKMGQEDVSVKMLIPRVIFLCPDISRREQNLPNMFIKVSQQEKGDQSSAFPSHRRAGGFITIRHDLTDTAVIN